ncbi:MAG: ribbon-helix-helix domain-containing protein, partial [Rhodospirillaceae bacterium]|nr:ribbon-helix-helix domain-containing protein [Rhodospirillaceae bacterium]
MSAPAAGAAPDAEGLKPRIIQADKRRFSLKLEPVFWDALEEIAAARGIRLNRLVAQVAGEAGASSNLASQLRRFCLTEVQRESAEARLGGSRL